MARTLRCMTAAIVLCLGFCLGEAFIAGRYFTQRGLLDELLQPSPHGLFVRLLGCGLIILSAAFWLIAENRRQRLFRALQADEKMYRELVENCPDGIIVHRNERVLYVNPAARAELGQPEVGELQNRSLRGFVHPDDWPAAARASESVLRGGRAGAPLHVRATLPDGTRRGLMVSSARIVFGGEPAVLTYCRDVTRDLATRADLAASRERLSLALEAAQDGVWDWDMEADRLIYNRAWLRMLGRESMSRSGSRGTWAGLLHPDDRERAEAALAAHLRGETTTYEAEVRVQHADGHYVWVLDRGKVVERSDDGTPRRMAGTHRNITPRKNAQLELAVRNRIAEAFLTSARDEVFPNVLALISGALGSPTGVLSTLESAQRLRIAVHDGAGRQPPVPPDTVLTRQDLPLELAGLLHARRPVIVNQPMRMEPLARHLVRSVSVPVVTQDKVLGFVTIADRAYDYDQNDVASLVALTGYLAPILEFHLESLAKEEQLRQAQKMEAIGALAGGIAHDFNNILQAILGFSTLALEEARTLETRPGGFIANDLERVVRATQRGRDLINRIRMFSRREEVERQPTDLAPLVAETVDLLRNMIPASIRVRAEVTAGCEPVLTDPMQISQILLNLATNAFHAMEKTGGDLVFGLRPVPAGSTDPHVPCALATQDLVELTVTDTGCGMDAETLARLYDPFFTTKEVDKGTGLGLSVVHGIVNSHRGEIVVESEVGRGSTIHVYLPTVAGADPVPAAPAAAGGQAGTRPPGRRILFLDDEPDIVDLGRALLEKQGHQVKALSDPQAALLHLQRQDCVFDLLITDLTMPRMTGLQFAEQVGRLRPDLPIVLITGMNDTGAEAWSGYPGIRGMLHKPFTGEALRAIIARVLESGERQPDTKGAAAPTAKGIDETETLPDDGPRQVRNGRPAGR